MKNVFGGRLLYVGLQGSYLRGEATEDLDSYKKIIMKMEHYEKSCGFICGIEEFSRWNPMELCHILHSTKDY